MFLFTFITLLSASNAESLFQESLERQGVRLDNMIAGPGDQEKQGKQETGSGYREENRTPVFRESSEYHDGSAGREQNYLQPGILNILA